MNNNTHHFNFPNIFDINIPTIQHNQHLQSYKQQPYLTKPSSKTYLQQTHTEVHHSGQDKRTEDQVIDNLSFSIQDLLSKISKVREECQVPVYNHNNHNIRQKKKEQPLTFKVSNLSVSTQTNSNKSKSDQYIEKCQYESWTTKTRGSEAKLEVVSNSEKSFKYSFPQTQVKRQEFKVESKKEIKNLLIPSETSAFGKAPQMYNRPPQKSPFFEVKASIIIQDEPKVKVQQTGPQPVPINPDTNITSLFGGRSIREIAASTIMVDSPQKKKQMIKMHNPFLDIVGQRDHVVESKIISPNQQFGSVPLIKINGVQKSEIIKQLPKLTIGDFHLGKQLGSGKFGDVYQAIHKQTGALFAIKKIFKSTILQYNMIEQFTRELKIHYVLDYPNIIKLFTHFDDEYHIFLVMEYGEGGMLMEKLKNGEKFASQIVQQMLRAVDYLQNKKIAHRDIKPQNIVMMFGDTAKLCDFGWSRVFDSEMKKTFCGTLDYVSPEMKDTGEYSMKIDIWSLGVLTFEIICGYAPFKNEINQWRNKGSNLNQKWNWNILYPPQISSVAESFMRNLLKQNPNQRASIRFCLGHLFVRKYNQMQFDEQQDKRYKQISNVLME